MISSNKLKFILFVLILIFVILAIVTVIFVYLNLNTRTLNIGNNSTKPTPTLDQNRQGKLANMVLKNGLNEKVLRVELAQTYEERMIGLMDRKELKDIDGMLFIFENESEQAFWMKNTYIPLDMVFYDDEGKFVSIQRNATPCIDQEWDCPSYYSNGKAKYVLETKAGFLSDEYISNGTSFTLTNP
jgi:uncharacterized membrane protein (UPF0127 family)